MTLVVDSSVLVAAFRPQERDWPAALKLLQSIENGEIVVIVPVTVIIEVVAAIRRRTGQPKLAALAAEKLLSLTGFSFVDVSAFRLIRYLSLAETIGLRGMDVIVVGVAREFDAPLITLDREMIDRAPDDVRVTDLSEVI